MPAASLRALAIAAAMVAALVAGAASAAPPPPALGPRDAGAPPAAPQAPRRVIRAPEPAPEAPAARPAAAPTAAGGPVPWYGEPSEAEQLAPAGTGAETRIEQRRQGNRIVEVIVTPAGAAHSYVMVNQEGQRPRSVQDLGSGLSLPQFLRIQIK